MAASPLANAIEFFHNFGLFDVVLPFLLIFSIVFAILEKTKILGVEGSEGRSKKNLNSMVSFVVALLVVASNKIITVLQVAIPNIILLVFVSFCFLLMVGIFAKTGELDLATTHPSYYKFFIGLMFAGVLLIFLGSMQTNSGLSWLEYAYRYVMANWGGSVVSSFILLAVVVGAIVYVVNPKDDSKKGGSD